jgi:hypothetical protein
MALVTIRCGRCRKKFSDFSDNEGNDFRYHVGLKTIGDEVQLRFNLRRVRCPFCGYVPGETLHEASLTVPLGVRKIDMQKVAEEYPYTNIYTVIGTDEENDSITFLLQEASTKLLFRFLFNDDGTYRWSALERPDNWRIIEAGEWSNARRHGKVVRQFNAVHQKTSGEVEHGERYAFYTNGLFGLVERIGD